MKRTFREKVHIRIHAKKTYARVLVPSGSLPKLKVMRVMAKLKTRVFPTSAWSFPTQAGFLIPVEVVREFGLQDGQPVEIQVEVAKKKPTLVPTPAAVAAKAAKAAKIGAVPAVKAAKSLLKALIKPKVKAKK